MTVPIKRFLPVFFLFSFLVLSGCGGGGSSSGSVGQPHATAYGGQYDGVLTFSASGLGASVSDSFAYRLVVGVDGLVSGSSPGFSGTGTCSDGPDVYLSGNVASATATITCYFPEVGNCSVPVTERAVFSNSAVSISGSATYYCEGGTFSATLSAYLTKTK